MNKKFLFTIMGVFILSGIILVFTQGGKYQSLMFLGVPVALILLSLIFFSRGILVFLTTLCLMLGQSHIEFILPIISDLRWVFFALFSFHVFGDMLIGRSARGIRNFDVLVGIFISYALLSVVYSPFRDLTIERTATILFLYISVFWVIWKYAYTDGPEKIVYLVLQAFLLILLTSYCLLFFNHTASFSNGRFQGVFSNPNSMGLICAILLPLSLWHFFESKKKSALFLFFLMLLSLFLSGSRGSLQAAVVSLGYFIYVRKKKYKPLVFFSLASFTFILFWVIETLAKAHFKSYIRAESIPEIGGRLGIWQSALNLIIEKPIFGHGFGVEDKIFGLKFAAYHAKAQIAYVHNSYLGMLIQLGVVGLIVFYLPLFVLLFKELTYKQHSDVFSLRLALRSSLIAGLLCCLYESWIYSVGNSQTFPFWVTVMLLLFCRQQDKEKISLEGT
jgi:exopolysaccharide production protein ExoQ